MLQDATNGPSTGGKNQILGSYELEQLIGEGSMGRVYLARHTRLGRKVALKILRPEHTRDRGVVQRFLQEARTVNQINHENIVEVFDFVEESENDRVWCVMELLQGKSLSALLHGGIAVSRGVEILRQICSALEAAHALGVVHRDLKPDNIFVCAREGKDRVKVLDFGVAKLLRLVSTAPRQGTVDGAIVGTPAYMSPEQAAGIEVDHRSDLYAVGTIGYEMLMGRTPFEAEGFGQLAVQIITKSPAPIGTKAVTGEPIPEGLAHLLMRCLEKDPAKRPQSAADIRAELGSLDAVEAAGASPKRSPLLFGGVGAAVLAAIGLIAFALRPTAPVAPKAVAPKAVEPPVVVAPKVEPVKLPEPPPPPATVRLEIRSNPAGAKVVRVDTGETLGVTPLNKTLPVLDREVTLKFELAGFQSAERKVSLDANAELEVVLVKVAPAPGERRPKLRPKPEGVTHDGVIDPFAQ